ncbi:methionine ABC transporter permease [uncultured Succinatimonas sp.]|uniref:methionine ABC transporter permease n=1 Tax=uncultured Succinatimonas sp. TaxID=1262973 RepID=UPI0025F945AB|nr:methionine ABC transporter permease [uncultured Succinatimonas sp.]
MLEATLDILGRELGKALWETLEMMIISVVISSIVGVILGFTLFTCKSKYFTPRPVLYQVLGGFINIVRSIPFIILIVFTLPLTFFITGTKIGPIAAAVPLSICAIAFLARLVESSLLEVDEGVLEASVAQGASTYLIVKDVLLVEAAPGLIRALTVTIISLIGFSAMAGMVGGGGIGNLAIQYGYYRYESGVMLFIIILLVAIVQFSQWLGDFIAKKLSH